MASRLWTNLQPACLGRVEQEPECRDSRPVSTYRLLASMRECGCSRDLEKAKALHSWAAYSGQITSTDVLTGLSIMYARCGSMGRARDVFGDIACPDVTCWTALLRGYVQNGQHELALDIFEEQGGCAPRPDARSYVVALGACAGLEGEWASGKILEKAKSLHSQAVLDGQCNQFVRNVLTDTYARCGNMLHARAVFDSTVETSETVDVICWNSLLKGYAENGRADLALDLFTTMEEVRDSRTYLAALTACSASDSLDVETVKSIHSQALRDGRCGCDSFVENMLVHVYAKCGKMVHARSVFDNQAFSSGVAWSSLLQGYVDNAESMLALDLFGNMAESGGHAVFSDRVYVAALGACASLGSEASEACEKMKWLEKGKALHSQAVMNKHYGTYVKGALVNMYARCGSLVHARQVFDSSNLVAWNTLLHAYVQNGDSEDALKLMDSMQEEAEVVPDSRTYVAALTACSTGAETDKRFLRSSVRNRWLEKGKAIHSQAVRSRCFNKEVTTSLIDVYGNCGNINHAGAVFNSRAEQQQSRESWNRYIQAHVDNEENQAALNMIARMDLSGIGHCPVTFNAALSACGNLMAEQTGKEFHTEIKLAGFEQPLAASLVRFYTRCNMETSMNRAQQVFDSIKVRDTSSWNAIICGYGQQGRTFDALGLFGKMREQGIRPDRSTFTVVLAACSHSGLTQQASRYFNAMQSEYGIKPEPVHYNCMVDLLGRANCIDEALKLVNCMPQVGVLWFTLLGACEKWNNVAVGRVAYEALLKLGSQNCGVDTICRAHTIMAGIFERTAAWETKECSVNV